MFERKDKREDNEEDDYIDNLALFISLCSGTGQVLKANDVTNQISVT